MRRDLKARLLKVVDAIGPITDQPIGHGEPPVTIEEFACDLTLRTVLGRYDDRRCQVLTLKERLAIARDDAVTATDRSAATAARALEVRILERDKKVSSADARRLRMNAAAHWSRGEELLPLPAPVTLDQAAVLAQALERCPRREDLPLEGQLELLHDDRRHQLAEREEVRRNPPPRPTWAGYRPPVDVSLDAFAGAVHKQLVRGMEQRIVNEIAKRGTTQPPAT